MILISCRNYTRSQIYIRVFSNYSNDNSRNFRKKETFNTEQFKNEQKKKLEKYNIKNIVDDYNRRWKQSITIEDYYKYFSK
jgi:hypothetical protein